MHYSVPNQYHCNTAISQNIRTSFGALTFVTNLHKGNDRSLGYRNKGNCKTLTNVTSYNYRQRHCARDLQNT